MNKRIREHLTEKVVYAVLQEQKGSSIKDFLTDSEISEALSMLADILFCTGVSITEEEDYE
jgi:hypothetical protein